MSELRLKCSVVSKLNIILQVEVATNQLTDYATSIRMLLRVIEISKYFDGFTIPTEEALVPETDENFPFATACYLKFENHRGAIAFIESIDPSNLD